MLTIFGKTGNVEVSETPRMILRMIKESKIPLGLVGLNGSGKSILLDQLKFDVENIINIRDDEKFETTQLINLLAEGRQVYFSLNADSNHKAIEKLFYYVGLIDEEKEQRAFTRPIALVHMVKTALKSKIIEKISIYPDGFGLDPANIRSYECLYRLHFNSPSSYGVTCVDTSEVVSKPSDRLCGMFTSFESLKKL